jgi:hypothetical protein
MQETSDIGTEQPRNRGAQPGNLNAARTLVYARDIEKRLDSRTLLAQGLKDHEALLLAEFGARSLNEIGTLEAEALRRLVKRRVVRELAWGRIQTAYERDDIEDFDEQVPRFQQAVDAEEKTEKRFEELLERYRKKRGEQTHDLKTYLKAQRDSASLEGEE